MFDFVSRNRKEEELRLEERKREKGSVFFDVLEKANKKERKRKEDELLRQRRT